MEKNLLRGHEIRVARGKDNYEFDIWVAWLGYLEGFILYLWRPKSNVIALPFKDCRVDVNYEASAVELYHPEYQFFSFQDEDLESLARIFEAALEKSPGGENEDDNQNDSSVDDSSKLEKKKALGQLSLQRVSLSGTTGRPLSMKMPKHTSLSNRLFGNVLDLDDK